MKTRAERLGRRIGPFVAPPASADPCTGRTPIIVSSGAVAELTAAKSQLRAQGGNVLVEPFDIDALVSKVRAPIDAACRRQARPG